MRWSEIIRLRSSGNHKNGTISKIKEMTQEIKIKTLGLLDLRIFRDASKNHDIAIQLIWETDKAQSTGSLAGLSICQDLKRYGLVVHSVWVEDI